jgi:NMD protein affecting ribosome stability and mRNA decay
MNDDFAELACPGCGGGITPRYALKGVCRDCYGTTDDPARDLPEEREGL